MSVRVPLLCIIMALGVSCSGSDGAPGDDTSDGSGGVTSDGSGHVTSDSGPSFIDVAGDQDTADSPDLDSSDVEAPCLPGTCADLGASCGMVPDGCGGEVNCGGCAENELCTDAWECECQPWCIGLICGDKDGCDGTCLIGSGCCTNECDTAGDVLGCEGSSVTMCAMGQIDNCLHEVTGVCDDGGFCHEGACCIPTCGDDSCGVDDGCGGVCAVGCCEPACEGVVCGDPNGCDGTCDEGSGCCTHACDTVDAVSCDGASVMTCTESDVDACLHLEVTEVCAGTATCYEGACCTATCTGKSCGDSDGCGGTCDEGSGCCSPDCDGKECGASDGCGGTCDASCCTDDCTAGQAMCIGPSIMVCGDYDSDACLDWSELEQCAEGSCQNGVCVEDPAGGTCVDPVEVVAGPGATGNGVCDATNLLENDGQVAEFWAGTDNTWDSLPVPVSACYVVDFGTECTPSDICVEFWAGSNGCSGDGCAGACGDCMTAGQVGIHVFAYPTNSTLSYEYQWTAYADEMSDPGKTHCYKPTDDPIRFVLVCRADCGADSYNAHIDHVWLQ